MNGLWEFLETFEWTPSTPLASEKPMFLTLLVYLLVVFGLQEVMSSRKTPSWVNPLVTLHNFILFAYSASSFVAVVILVTQASISDPDGFLSVFCDQHRRYLSGPIYGLVYIFYLSKYYELLDTVILALKKRPIIFLHVFHHVLTLYISREGMNADTTYQWCAVATNTFIHSLMYAHYALASLGYKNKWKRYLTVAQMIQFFVNVAILFAWAGVDSYLLPPGQSCSGDYYSWSLMFFAMLAFWVLFYAFYRKSYTKKPKSKSQ